MSGSGSPAIPVRSGRPPVQCFRSGEYGVAFGCSRARNAEFFHLGNECRPLQAKACCVYHDGSQPCGHLRLPLEFVQVPPGAEECVLHCIFCIGQVVDTSKRHALKIRKPSEMRLVISAITSALTSGITVSPATVSIRTPQRRYERPICMCARHNRDRPREWRALQLSNKRSEQPTEAGGSASRDRFRSSVSSEGRLLSGRA